MNKRWRYRLERPAITTCHWLDGLRFENDWVTVGPRGLMCVRAGYAWDGASPALRIPRTRFWLGTWDGPIMPNGRPAAYRATLFHDALCQFRHEIPGLTLRATTAVFASELADAGAPAWMQRLYPAGVSWFGPQDFPGDDGAALA